MPILTAVILAAFAAYAAAWYVGVIQGNFALLLFLATVVTGLYWLAERFIFLPRRRAAADALQQQADQRRADLAAQGITQVDQGDLATAREVAKAIGYSIGTLWLPMFIAWLAKFLVLRYGGMKLYRVAMDFFIGLLLGDFIIGCLWPVVGWILKVPTYSFMQ